MDDADGSLVLNIEELKFLKGITTIHWNCRSLFPKFDEVVLMIRDSNCEICVLTETWLTTAVSDQYLCIPNYNFLRLDRCSSTGKRCGGGVLVYVKDNVKAAMVPELSISSASVELITLRISLDYTRPIYMMYVYRPPDQNVSEFINIMDGS